MKVTNNHDAPLNVAGVDVRPGKSAEVDKDKFSKWSNGNAAKAWLKQELITTSEKFEPEEKSKEPTEREKMMARAEELKLTVAGNISNANLQKAIEEAEAAEAAAKGDTEREALMAEARALLLNPNANTPTDKLKEMIAEAKA